MLESPWTPGGYSSSRGEERPCASEKKRHSRVEQSGVGISLEATTAAAAAGRSCQGRRDRSRESQPLSLVSPFQLLLTFHYITCCYITLHYLLHYIGQEIRGLCCRFLLFHYFFPPSSAITNFAGDCYQQQQSFCWLLVPLVRFSN